MLAVKLNRYITFYRIIYCILRGQQLIFSDGQLVKGFRAFREFAGAVKFNFPIYIYNQRK